jgi:hypothetical protein
VGQIIRVSNWESILNDELVKADKLTFEYGVFDCTTWAAKVLRSYSNLDWFPSWTNKKEAIKLHRSRPMENQVSDVVGERRGNILLTNRGDIVQKGTGIKSSLGICIGRKVAFAYEKGLCYTDLIDCKYSWRI